MRRTRDFTQGRPTVRTALAKRSTDPRVTVEELEDVCGLPPGAGGAKLAALKIRVAGDWAGRPSVSLADAARVYAEVSGDLADHAAKWQAYSDYVETRAAQLAAAITAAAAEARQGVSGAPAQEAKAAEASRRARERFEAEHPLVDFADYRPGGDSL